MLTLYWVTFAIGAVMILVTALLGGHMDVDSDFDAGVDADAGGDIDGDVDHGVDVGFGDLWLPIASMRFWTFFSAFFGLTGLLLSFFVYGPAANPTVPVLFSVGAGYVGGIAIVRTMRALQKQNVDSNLTENDYIGATATVVLAVANDKTGKVRLEIKDRIVEMLASTEDSAPLGIRDRVIVYGVTDDGKVLVSKTDKLEAQRA